MKVALCLSGLSRSFIKGKYSYLQYLIEPLNADVFVHSWNDIMDSGRILNVSKYKKQTELNDFKIFGDYLKDIKLESFFNFQSKYNCIGNSFPMFYSINQSNNLKKAYEEKHNFKYDLVIRSRMDLYFESNLPDCELNSVNNNNIFVRLHDDGYQNEVKNYIITDIFAFGNTHVMDIYSNTFLEQSGLNTIMPEKILGNQLNQHNIIVNISSFKFKMLTQWNSEGCVFYSHYFNTENMKFITIS
jgi:hypothetical protein